MSLGQTWFLSISATAAFIVAVAAGWMSSALAAFGCFYTPPIGGEKCAHPSGPDPFWTGFYDALGLFSIPWTLMLVFFLVLNIRRTR